MTQQALIEALTRLADAASVFAADQSGARDDRCGLVQPVTVAEAEELNNALAEADMVLSKARGEPTDLSAEELLEAAEQHPAPPTWD